MRPNPHAIGPIAFGDDPYAFLPDPPEDDDMSDEYREHLVREKAHARDRIMRKAKSMRDQLDGIARLCHTQDDPIINELGELQGQATMFDAHCATYGAIRQALKDYDTFATSEER